MAPHILFPHTPEPLPSYPSTLPLSIRSLTPTNLKNHLSKRWSSCAYYDNGCSTQRTIIIIVIIVVILLKLIILFLLFLRHQRRKELRAQQSRQVMKQIRRNEANGLGGVQGGYPVAHANGSAGYGVANRAGNVTVLGKDGNAVGERTMWGENGALPPPYLTGAERKEMMLPVRPEKSVVPEVRRVT